MGALALAKKERKKIFRLFCRNRQLRFNEIEKATKLRSNMLSYHLQVLVKKGFLHKQQDHYRPTSKAERYLPIVEEPTTPLPVVLCAITRANKLLLIKRAYRPYKNYWSLLGGKMLFDEDFADATSRLVKERTTLGTENIRMAHVMQERIIQEQEVAHNFLLFFTRAELTEKICKQTEHGKLRWFSLDKLPEDNMILSDLWFVKHKLHDDMPVKTATMQQANDQLSCFRIA